MRPRKLNEALVDLIIQCRKDGLTVTETCEAADITMETLSRWRRIGRKEKEGLCHGLDNALTAIAEENKKRKAQRRKEAYIRKLKQLQDRYQQHGL